MPKAVIMLKENADITCYDVSYVNRISANGAVTKIDNFENFGWMPGYGYTFVGSNIVSVSGNDIIYVALMK